MTPLGRTLTRIAEDLTRARSSFALVGGLAVSVRTEPRFTRDADIAVAVASDTEGEALVYSLRTGGYAVTAIVEQEAIGRLATVRLNLTGAEELGIVVDLLFASTGIEGEIVSAAERLKVLEGIELPVATVGHLLAMKVLSRDDVNRPQDLIDLRALLKAASRADIAEAKAAMALIQARGYSRGRDLLKDFSLLTSITPI